MIAEQKGGIPPSGSRQGADMDLSDEARNAALSALYGPSALDLARSLADVGEALAAQLQRLAMDPDPTLALDVATNLGGAQRACMRLRERLQAEGQGGDR